MLVAILDNSLESQMYKEILDECDWDEEFAFKDGDIDGGLPNTDNGNEANTGLDGNEVIAIEELSDDEQAAVNTFLTRHSYKSISNEEALDNFKKQSGQSLSKWDEKKLSEPFTAKIKRITSRGKLTLWLSNYMKIPEDARFKDVSVDQQAR